MIDRKSSLVISRRARHCPNIFGFTLVEMMLVLVIISILIWGSIGYMQQRSLQMRMDRTSIQMQQILNAGLAYYVTNGSWPLAQDGSSSSLSMLIGTYLPPTIMNNPWNQPYQIAVYSPPPSPEQNIPPPLFYVYTAVKSSSATLGSATAAANVIAGTLPLSYTSTDTSGSATQPPSSGATCGAGSTTCYVVASVNIPGQNLNNARAVNFAGLYKHGGCIPVPQCPTDPTGATVMTPQVMVVPVSVSGINDQSSSSQNIYPISSFTAYAKGNTPLDVSPPMCLGSTSVTGGNDCSVAANVGTAATAYWRACLKIITEKGDVQATRSDQWGQNVTLMAITRCAASNEPAGSTFDVYSN